MFAHGCWRRADLKTTRHAKPLHATNAVRDVKEIAWEWGVLAHDCRRRADLKMTRHAKPLHATNTVRDVKQIAWEREGC